MNIISPNLVQLYNYCDNNIYFVSSSVPQPTVTLVIRESATPYVGNVIKLVCNIQLSGALTSNEVSVSVRWLKDGRQTKVPTPFGSGGMIESTLYFNPLLSSDSGSYRCEVTLTAYTGTSHVMKTSPQLTLTVPSEY